MWAIVDWLWSGCGCGLRLRGTEKLKGTGAVREWLPLNNQENTHRPFQSQLFLHKTNLSALKEKAQ